MLSLSEIWAWCLGYQTSERGCSLKNMWIVARVAGVAVCLFFYVSSVKENRSTTSQINQTQVEVDQAWKDLERATPELAGQYSRAVKKRQEGVGRYSFHDTRALLLAFPLALLLTSLLWQFVVVPIRTWRCTRQPISSGASS